MKLTDLQRELPSKETCYELLELLENEYCISIKMWVSVVNPPFGELAFVLFVNGSGDIWDTTLPAGITGRARLVDAFSNSFYNALWSCLSQLHDEFKRSVPVTSVRTSLRS